MPCRARHSQFSRYVSGGIIHDTHGEECKRAAPVPSSTRNPPVKVVIPRPSARVPSRQCRCVARRAALSRPVNASRSRARRVNACGRGRRTCTAGVRGAPLRSTARGQGDGRRQARAPGAMNSARTVHSERAMLDICVHSLYSRTFGRRPLDSGARTEGARVQFLRASRRMSCILPVT